MLIRVVADYGQPTVEDQIETLHREFVSLNPESLTGWVEVPPGPKRMWRGWSRDGISYFDRDGDGIPDMKYREHPRMSTTEVWWEDTNYDGLFDTEVSQGCFHHNTRPLNKPIAVPRPTKTKRSRYSM